MVGDLNRLGHAKKAEQHDVLARYIRGIAWARVLLAAIIVSIVLVQWSANFAASHIPACDLAYLPDPGIGFCKLPSPQRSIHPPAAGSVEASSDSLIPSLPATR